MDLVEINEELFNGDHYITQKMLDSKKNHFLSFATLKKNLSAYSIDVPDDVLKTAILATNGETREILLYLLQQAHSHIQINAFLKNRSLLKDYPWKTLDSIVIATLIVKNPTYVEDLYDPALFAKTIKQINISSKFNASIIPDIIKSDPTIIDYNTSWNFHITKDLLLQLGFHTVFTIPEMIADLGETVGLIALCHGIAFEKIVTTCPITRFMQPWTTCTFSSSKYKLNLFRKMVARKHILEDEFLVYPPSQVPTSVKPQDYKHLEHMLELTKDMNSPLIRTFEVNQPMLGKQFTDRDNGFEYDGFHFLLVKGKTKTFNLFSLKHVWDMKEILPFFSKRRLLFLDYSCNEIHSSLSISPQELARLGGTRPKTTYRPSRKVVIR